MTDCPMPGIRQGLLPQTRAACSDEMMPDSLDLPGFSIRIEVRRLYPATIANLVSGR
jgi:hypothetical protein